MKLPRSEQMFLDTIANKNKTYNKVKKTFRLSGNKKYTPDFYCVEDDTYIEVVGSNSRPNTYAQFRKEYPDIKFEVIKIKNFNPSQKNKGGTHIHITDKGELDALWKEFKKKCIDNEEDMKAVIKRMLIQSVKDYVKED